jgi:hypothetical protein
MSKTIPIKKNWVVVLETAIRVEVDPKRLEQIFELPTARHIVGCCFVVDVIQRCEEVALRPDLLLVCS